MDFLLDFLSMLRIRLQRVGRKHESSFRVVLTESQNSTKSGRVQEVLGSYDPRFNKPAINAERVKHWIGFGAKPTDTMHNLLVSEKIIEGKKINVLSRKSPIKKEVAAKEGESQPKAEASAPVEEAELSAEEPVAEEKTEEKAEASADAEETAPEAENTPAEAVPEEAK